MTLKEFFRRYFIQKTKDFDRIGERHYENTIKSPKSVSVTLYKLRRKKVMQCDILKS